MPTLYLAYNKNGGFNIEPGESSTIILRTIQSSEGSITGGRQEYPIDNSKWNNVNEGTVVKLLSSKEDAKHFEVRAVKPETLKVPQK